VLSTRARTEHLSRGVGEFDQFVTIPAGIDLAPFRREPALADSTRATLRLPEPPPSARSEVLAGFKPFVVGWIGRYEPVKGSDVFLRACRLLVEQGDVPYAVFVMAGSGNGRADAGALSRELGIGEMTRVLGHREDVVGLLNACDVFVQSSRNEGFGLAAVEAMACGTPIVATDVGGVRELLADGAAGLLVPPGQPAAIAASVIRLAKDEELRTRLAVAGMRRSREFGIERTAECFAGLYEELAGG
jgi:glycosyltransferase involved in cell wall biosynthesis